MPNYMTWPQSRDVGIDATKHRPLWQHASVMARRRARGRTRPCL
jgi:hypothetical protein